VLLAGAPANPKEIMKIIHHNDLDGRASAFCVAMWGPKRQPCEFIEINYGRPFPLERIGDGEEVWIVDYSIELEEMRQLLERTVNVVWIDHHFTALDKYQDLAGHIMGVRSTLDAACALTFKYIHWWARGGVQDRIPTEQLDPAVTHPKSLPPVPAVIRAVADWDSWRHASMAPQQAQEVLNFKAASEANDTHPTSRFWLDCLMREGETRPKEPYTAGHLPQGLAQWNLFMAQGSVIRQYKAQNTADMRAALGFECELDGLHVFALNAPHWSSESMGGKLAMEKYDALCPFFFDASIGLFRFSLYSTRVDVSQIAKARGGGGHKGAAGFQSPALPFTNITPPGGVA